MDPVRFDALTKTLSPTGTRRALLRRLAPLPVAGILAIVLGRETTQADGSGAIAGGGNRRRNRGKPNHHHTRDHGDDNCNRKCSPCKRCKNGSCKKKRDGTVCQGDGVCTNGQCTTGGSTLQPPPPCTGTPLGGSCAPGAPPCCTDVNPNATCGSLFAAVPPANRTCQDCSGPPTAAGALCQTQTGNQCCGGRADCFVGIRVDTDQPDCFSSGICDVALHQPPCTQNYIESCPSGQTCCPETYPICAQATSGCLCTATFCGVRCA